MITVTGASGQLGRLVVSKALAKHPGERIVAAVRNRDKAKTMFPGTVELRDASYDRPDTLDAAFAGADRLLFISSSELGPRQPQHTAVVEAAQRAGVTLLVYTSLLHADTSGLHVAVDHRATECAVRASGIPSVILRNGFYFENQTEQLATVLEHGVIEGSAGEGRISGASRADFAEAAVNALFGTERGRTYELAGDHAYSQIELAAEVARQSGKAIRYQNLEPARYRALLLARGLSEPMADLFVDNDRGIARGELEDRSGHLQRLLGRPTSSLAEAVKAGLASLRTR